MNFVQVFLNVNFLKYGTNSKCEHFSCQSIIGVYGNMRSAPKGAEIKSTWNSSLILSLNPEVTSRQIEIHKMIQFSDFMLFLKSHWIKTKMLHLGEKKIRIISCRNHLMCRFKMWEKSHAMCICRRLCRL